MRDVAADESTWVDRLRTPGDDHWWTRLYADESLDIWLLTWLPGHGTELHDHGRSAAAFTVVRGALEEVRVTATGETTVTSCERERATVVSAGVIHDVRAVGRELAVSIHVYSPPLTRMTYYDRDDDGVLRRSRYEETDRPEPEQPR